MILLPRYYKRCLHGLALALVFMALGILYLGVKHSEIKTPRMSLLLRDRHGYFLGQVKQEATDTQTTTDPGYGYWPIKELPQRVVEATLTLEDKRFRSHPGVDPIAFGRAVWQNISNRQRISGASTIAMQVARMQNPGPRTYFRKMVETVSAIMMTMRYGRDQVLRQYLTIVPYGQSCHGIAYASRLFLNKPVEDLSWAEIAFLSAIPHAPSRMNPYSYSGRYYAIKRGKRILNILYERDLMTYAELNLSLRQIDEIVFPKKNRRLHFAIHPILKLGKHLQEDQDPLVYASLDLNLQSKVHELALQLLTRWKKQGAGNVAAIVTRRTTGEVLAYLGSHGYFDPDAGAIDYATVKRSSGSTLKPFIYALALERGQISPNTIIDDLPNNSMGFSNAEMKFLGPMLPRQALANSRNIPAINVLKKTGIDETYLLLETLGLHEGRHSADYYGLTIAVGGLPVSLEDLVQAYTVLANDGQMINFVWRTGQKRSQSQRIISKDVSRLITLYLSDPMARLPSFPRMGTTEYPFSVAVKTGTSQDHRDAWCVAYSNDYLVGVWVGRADNRPMNKLGGAGSAAELVQKILLYLHKDHASGIADLSFPAPDNYVPVEICAHSGGRASDLCKHVFVEWFPPDQIPGHDKSHRVLALDKRNGLLATQWTPKDMIKGTVFLDLPSRYREWAETEGIARKPEKYSPLDIPEGESIPLYASSPTLKGAVDVSIRIDSPKEGMKIMSNPETPDEMNSMALRLTLNEDIPQVLWYVDGVPYAIVEAPYTTRWTLKKGIHTFQAKLPYRSEKSELVRVFVQ